MYWEQFGRVIVHVKRALRKDRRLTAEEFNQLLQLSDAIIEYGRMIQEHRRCSVPNVILEITELANASERRHRPLKTRSCCLIRRARADHMCLASKPLSSAASLSFRSVVRKTRP
jgi:hypothetical protein